MHCAGSTSPTLSGISPTLSGISPAAIIAYFPELASPAADSRHRFLRLSACPYHNSTGPSARWPMPPISVGGFRQPSSQLPFLLLASVAVSVGRSQPPSPSPDWDFLRFPLCGPLSGTAAEIFTGSLGATGVLWKLPRRRLTHFWGACAFYLLSMVSLHTKTSFLTKPHGSKLSLSSFYGLSHGTGQPLP